MYVNPHKYIHFRLGKGLARNVDSKWFWSESQNSLGSFFSKFTFDFHFIHFFDTFQH